MSAVDGASNTKTGGFQLSVANGTSATLTYELNGNMTSDGTNSYSWDAENRMTKITYPGTNNYSTFVFDALGRNVSIIETVSGSVTSTKQFVWCSDKMRHNQPCEARNAGGTITAQYFGFGETISGTSYYWSKDHLDSVREMTNSSGVMQDQRSYDPFGRQTQLQGTQASDFQYAGYYAHAASGLNLTLYRAYSSGSARWLSRDPIGEQPEISGLPPGLTLADTVLVACMPVGPAPVNPLGLGLSRPLPVRVPATSSLFEYAGNRPVVVRDPSGLFGCQICYAFGPVCAAGCMAWPEPQKTACVLGCTAAFIWCFANCDWMDDLPDSRRPRPCRPPKRNAR